MRYLALVLVFAACLFVKASTVMGAEPTYGDPIELQDNTSNNNNNNNNNNNSASAAAAASASAVPQINNYSYAPPPTTMPAPPPLPQNQAATVENNNNITFGSQSPIVQGRATGPGAQASPSVAYRSRAHYGNPEEAADIIEAKEHEEHHEHLTTITPMIGGAWYAADWSNVMHNSYSLGLGIEYPLSGLVSIEGETGYSRYTMDYLTPNPFNPRVTHNVNQFNFGGNLKLYLTRSSFRPYFGAGLMGLYYDNMLERHRYFDRYYSQMIGAGQLLGGADICIASGVSVGMRGAWVVPLFNRPQTFDNGAASLPPYQEASAINTSFYKLMGTVSVAF